MDKRVERIHKKYDRVMSRVFNRSRSSVNSSSLITRHDLPSSIRDGGKQSVSNVSSGVFSDLPKVLNDYSPVKPVKRTSVVKPRKTVKSLDPAVSPPRLALRPQGPIRITQNLRVKGSAPALRTNNGEKWSDSHLRQCCSSRSHSKLKDLKDEIRNYEDTEKLVKLRSHLYHSCGVLLDNEGQLAEDKAVQVQPTPELDLQTDSMTRGLAGAKGMGSAAGSSSCTVRVQEASHPLPSSSHLERASA